MLTIAGGIILAVIILAVLGWIVSTKEGCGCFIISMVIVGLIIAAIAIGV